MWRFCIFIVALSLVHGYDQQQNESKISRLFQHDDQDTNKIIGTRQLEDINELSSDDSNSEIDGALEKDKLINSEQLLKHLIKLKRKTVVKDEDDFDDELQENNIKNSKEPKLNLFSLLGRRKKESSEESRKEVTLNALHSTKNHEKKYKSRRNEVDEQNVTESDAKKEKNKKPNIFERIKDRIYLKRLEMKINEMKEQKEKEESTGEPEKETLNSEISLEIKNRRKNSDPTIDLDKVKKENSNDSDIKKEKDKISDIFKIIRNRRLKKKIHNIIEQKKEEESTQKQYEVYEQQNSDENDIKKEKDRSIILENNNNSKLAMKNKTKEQKEVKESAKNQYEVHEQNSDNTDITEENDKRPDIFERIKNRILEKKIIKTLDQKEEEQSAVKQYGVYEKNSDETDITKERDNRRNIFEIILNRRSQNKINKTKEQEQKEVVSSEEHKKDTSNSETSSEVNDRRKRDSSNALDTLKSAHDNVNEKDNNIRVKRNIIEQSIKALISTPAKIISHLTRRHAAESENKIQNKTAGLSFTHNKVLALDFWSKQ